MSVELLEVFVLGVGTALRLESDAWKWSNDFRQAKNKYAPSPPAPAPDFKKRWGAVFLCFVYFGGPY